MTLFWFIYCTRVLSLFTLPLNFTCFLDSRDSFLFYFFFFVCFPFIYCSIFYLCIYLLDCLFVYLPSCIYQTMFFSKFFTNMTLLKAVSDYYNYLVQLSSGDIVYVFLYQRITLKAEATVTERSKCKPKRHHCVLLYTWSHTWADQHSITDTLECRFFFSFFCPECDMHLSNTCILFVPLTLTVYCVRRIKQCMAKLSSAFCM